ncbi:hypothetical protein N9934_04220 [Desulfosarcina sp.]|nr:hypothetical protein [Desulfosarcina sp.]
MDNNDLQDAQRCFGNIREAYYQLETTFQRLCTGMADLQERLDRLENVNTGTKGEQP